ncbi:MAG: NAD(P)-dependent oxidoreductase [Saprospiraceae bacterium]
MKKVLVTDYVHPSLISGLENRGYIVDYDKSVNMDVLPDVIHKYDGVIINSKIRMYKDTIDKASKLKFIGRLGSGLEIVDLEYAKLMGIAVINTPSGNNNAVAEHAMGMLLMLANNLRQADQDVRRFNWAREKNRGWELKGKTIGIIGFGHTGSQFAKKLSSWELNIISYDKYKHNFGPNFNFIERVSLQDILSRSDVISLHLPLTAETKHLVNADFIKRCKDNVVIINTSRGNVIKTEDLLSGLESDKVGGACLDVLENEKPNTYTQIEQEMYSKIFKMENVVLSPHVAGWTHESLKNIADILLDKLDIVI